jgi:hypothetical protein
VRLRVAAVTVLLTSCRTATPPTAHAQRTQGTGDRMPDQLCRIAKALGVPVTELLQ